MLLPPRLMDISEICQFAGQRMEYYSENGTCGRSLGDLFQVEKSFLMMRNLNMSSVFRLVVVRGELIDLEACERKVYAWKSIKNAAFSIAIVKVPFQRSSTYSLAFTTSILKPTCWINSIAGWFAEIVVSYLQEDLIAQCFVDEIFRY